MYTPRVLIFFYTYKHVKTKAYIYIYIYIYEYGQLKLQGCLSHFTSLIFQLNSKHRHPEITS
jgi:hypothetical protein